MFLSGDPSEVNRDEAAGMRAVAVTSRTTEGLTSGLASCIERASTETPPVFLHYVCYGYAQRGCPVWLVEGLERWKNTHPQSRLITMFHELYAFGPPWRSSFWLSPLQRRLARKVWDLSDGAITSSPVFAARLDAWRRRGSTPLLQIPVFSNVAEPAQISAWSVREPKMVVFGRAGIESRVYGLRSQLLAQVCHELAISEIVDIGPRTDTVPEHVDGIKVTALGHLSTERVSTILASARAGFLDYASHVLEKSGVFAAYAAHGVLPVVTKYIEYTPSDLMEGVHYWAPGRRDRPTSLKPDFVQIGLRLHAWYEDHALSRQAAKLAPLLRGDPLPASAIASRQT